MPEGLKAKILAVMGEVESVIKDSRNEFHKYDYASDAAIVKELRKALIKNRLILIPDQKAVTFPLQNSLCITQVEYTLSDVDSDEKLVTMAYGSGADNGDKALMKSLTSCEKYYLLKTFLIPTEDDAEKESPELRKPLPPPVHASSPKPINKASTKPSKAESAEAVVSVEQTSEKEYKPGKFRYGIKGSDGEWYSTFSKTLKEEADAAQAAGLPITLTYNVSEFNGKEYRNIEGMVNHEGVHVESSRNA